MSEKNKLFTEFVGDSSVKFTARANPVPYSHRITYRMAELCLVIKKSTNSGGVSLTKINIISEAISSDEKLNKLKAFIKNSQVQYIVKYDPATVRVLQYLMYEGLIILQRNQKYKLTEKGKEFVKKIVNDKSVLINEKKMLDEIGCDLKEEKIDQLQLEWRY